MAPRPRKVGSKDLPPNLYKKTDSRSGVTYYAYRDPVSGRMFGLGKDKARAIQEAIEANHTESLQPTIADRLSSEPSRPPRLFDDWLTEYEKIYVERGLAAASVRNTRMRLKRLRARFGTMDIRDIGTIDVAGYFSEMAKEGKAQMARAMRSLLRDVFMESMAAGWTDKNPVEVTKAARVKIKRERLTLETWRLIYAEAKQPWLKRAMELAVITGQRREDLAAMQFKDEQDGYLQVVQSKTGMRLRISTSIGLAVLGLDLASVIKSCRGRVLSRYMIHHHRTISRAKAGQPIMLDTISAAFADARDRAAKKHGLDFGASPPSFHEMRSLAARLHEEEGRDAQRLLGHRSAKMTDLYRDSRGAEWIDVA
ncbi:integrase [Pseudomonas aeruginosa]|uniref:phage integrase Arm DNA-binding domain-containing protein n=2 Tax=Pseudomonas aeruginosa TaxID=287 RepID=UPI000F53AA71|nr:phage integrase Arm DNA-binding domain-containing protein [Pseudomonas aeruginosa]RPY68049.1 integrase [Pseudomonas aeruginosa]